MLGIDWGVLVAWVELMGLNLFTGLLVSCLARLVWAGGVDVQKGGMMKPICPLETPMDGDFSFVLKILFSRNQAVTIESQFSNSDEDT